jgi:hypothetical protein
MLQCSVNIGEGSPMDKVTKSVRKPPAKGGSRKGIPNKTTGALKEAILKAAELSGRDKKGKDGLVGYLRRVADEDVKAFSGLLGKVLPMTITSDPDAPLKVEFTWKK